MKNIRGMIAYNQNSKLWVAMSLEFGLAAQAFTEQDAKQKLIAQIQEYIDDASGIDKAHKSQLLSRKAPFNWYIRYYWLAMKEALHKNNHSLIFCQSANDYATHA